MGSESMVTTPLPFGARPVLDLQIGATWLEVLPVPRGESPRVVAPVALEVRREGETVVVRGSGVFPFWDGTAEHVKVYVPRHVQARVTAEMGRVQLSGLEGCDLEVSTSAGSLELSDVWGRLNLKAHAGQVRGERLGGTFQVEAGAGAVRLDIVYLDPGQHQVHSTMGSVRVDLAPSQQVRLDAHTVMGSTRVQYPSSPEAAAVLRLEADLGSVRVREGAPFVDPRHGDREDWRRHWASPAQPQPAPADQGEELRRILGLVKDGKLTTEEAERLIRALGPR